jgi:succinyl-diaminopimelate desuccinylase
MSLENTLLWLCQIASPTKQEGPLANALLARLEKLGCSGTVRRYGDSLVVPLRGDSGGPHLVLAGHLDVVRTEHDAPPRIEGEKLFGPGAADMKSGLSLMLGLAEEGVPSGLDLTLVFYAREEGPYDENELGRVLDEDSALRDADLAIALEPSDNKLQLGCGGSLHATARFRGKTAHSARPWQGENAIHKAGPLFIRLAALAPSQDQVEGLTWNEVVSATLAQGGRARNIIPDIFEINLNHRFGPGTSLERAEAKLYDLVNGEAELEIVDRSPPAPPVRSHPLVQMLAESGVHAVEPKQAWTDVARFAAFGIPAVNFGPGEQAQAHQRNEWTSLPKLMEGREILARFLSRVGNSRTKPRRHSAGRS